jgi:hypothetical protein
VVILAAVVVQCNVSLTLPGSGWPVQDDIAPAASPEAATGVSDDDTQGALTNVSTKHKFLTLLCAMMLRSVLLQTIKALLPIALQRRVH